MIEQLTKQLRRDEGEKLAAYQDHLGYWTIGVGRLIDDRKGGGLTAEESAYLLQNDIDRKEAALVKALPWVNSLSEARKGVLVNMAFQLGVAGLLAFKNTLKAIEAGDYEAGAAGMGNSKWAQQTPGRCARLQKQLITSEWQ